MINRFGYHRVRGRRKIDRSYRTVLIKRRPRLFSILSIVFRSKRTIVDAYVIRPGHYYRNGRATRGIAAATRAFIYSSRSVGRVAYLTPRQWRVFLFGKHTGPFFDTGRSRTLNFTREHGAAAPPPTRVTFIELRSGSDLFASSAPTAVKFSIRGGRDRWPRSRRA